MVPLTPFSLYTDASLWGWGGGNIGDNGKERTMDSNRINDALQQQGIEGSNKSSQFISKPTKEFQFVNTDGQFVTSSSNRQTRGDKVMESNFGQY